MLGDKQTNVPVQQRRNAIRWNQLLDVLPDFRDELPDIGLILSPVKTLRWQWTLTGDGDGFVGQEDD